MIFRSRNQKIVIGLILLLFAVLFSLVSFPNHYFFRTYALDLGLFNNAVYDFSRLKSNDVTLFVNDSSPDFLSDHFSPITILLSPLRFFFGTYCLLVFQVFCVVLSGWVVFRICAAHSLSFFTSTGVVLYSFFFFGVINAVAFDYHNDVPAVTAVLFLYLYHLTGKTKLMLIAFVLVLMCKENMALWMFFVMAALTIESFVKKKRSDAWLRFSMAGFALIYFIVIIQWIMPFFGGGEKLGGLLRYSHLGNSLGDMLQSVFVRPGEIFSLLYADPFNDGMWVKVKMEFYQMCLLSGGVLILLRPLLFVWCIPLLFLKLLSNDYGFWGINSHYNVVFLPVFCIALVQVLTLIHNIRWQKILAMLVCAGAFYATASKLEHRVSPYYFKENVCFYCAEHFSSDREVSVIYEQLDKIPDDATVSCSSPLAAHLAFRDNIYHFPFVRNAEYIAVLKQGSFYPLSKEEWNTEVDEVKQNDSYTTKFENADLLIFVRK